MPLVNDTSNFGSVVNRQGPISYDRTLNILDPAIQHVISGRLEANMYMPDDTNPILSLVGDAGDITGMQGEHLGENKLVHAINKINMPQHTGSVTIHKQKLQRRTMSPGDLNQSPEDVRSTEYVSYTYSVEEWSPDLGYDINTARYQGTRPFSEIAQIEAQWAEDVKSFSHELLIIRACGRLGLAKDYAWMTFGTGNEVRTDPIAKLVGEFYEYNEDVQIATNPEAHKFMANDQLRQPIERFAPWHLPKGSNTDRVMQASGGAAKTGSNANFNYVKAFRENPTHNPMFATEGDSLSVNFLQKIRTWVGEAERNALFRGMRLERPTIMQIKDAKGDGVYTRVADKNIRATLFISEYSEADFWEDDKWEQLQNNLATAIGVKTGISTGAIGDLAGIRMYKMPLGLLYPGGTAANPVTISRSLMFGRGAMICCTPRYEPIPSMYRNSTKTFMKPMMDVNQLIKVYLPARGIGKRSGLFWQTWLNYFQVHWDFKNPNRPNGVSNIVAIDSVAANG